MSTTVIRKACARFPGFVLLAVTPFCRADHFLFFRLFFEKSAPEGKMARNQMFWVPGDHFFGARNFSDFLGFSTSPNIASCCAPGTSGIRDFHFLLGVGIRAPHSVIRRLGAGIQSLESGIAAFGSPTRPSISTYSRSTAPAAVILCNIKFMYLDV